MASLLTGFIDGFITWNDRDAGTRDVDIKRRMIPFQSNIAAATLNYTGTLQTVKTFNSSGLKVSTGACLTEISATFEFSTSIANLGVLQAATGTMMDVLKTPPTDQWEYSQTAVVPSGGVINLDFNPLGGTLRVATLDGVPVTGTFADGSESTPAKFTVTLEGDSVVAPVGTRITLSYRIQSKVGQKVIRLGSGDRLPTVGLFGRFFGCEGSYLVLAKRVVLTPNLNLAVGDNPAEISFTGECLADANDTLVTLVEWNP